tara:strand:- start:535 stop:732 length:198 start_codon:yes stop_codon:yes gene_type:complete
MKQLDMFEENLKNLDSDIYTPNFDDWYSENSHERRQYGEKPYKKAHAVKVYRHLVETGFFHKRGK